MNSFEMFLQKLMGSLYSPVLAAVSEALLILIAAFLTVKIGGLVIGKLIFRRQLLRDAKKSKTLSGLITSILKYVVYIAAAVMILSDVLGLKSILAAAGVGGVALGLGLQGLIKDVVSGFFIIMEDQFSVGDDITIDEMKGTVEELGFRLTRLRSANGDLMIIPNGEIKKVVNHSRYADRC